MSIHYTTHTQRRVCKMNRANEPYMLILWCAHLRGDQRREVRELEITESFRHHFLSRSYLQSANKLESNANTNSILLCGCLCVCLYTKAVIFIAFKSVFPLSAGATCVSRLCIQSFAQAHTHCNHSYGKTHMYTHSLAHHLPFATCHLLWYTMVAAAAFRHKWINLNTLRLSFSHSLSQLANTHMEWNGLFALHI